MNNHHPRPTPSWWPADEPWPPARFGRRQHWGKMRGQFLRRGLFVVIFMAVFMVVSLTMLGVMANTLLSFIPLSPQVLFILRPMVVFVVCVLIFVIMRSVVLLRRSAIPISEFLDGVGRVADGDYSIRLQEKGSADLREMSRAFNHMVEKLHDTDEQRRRLLADVTHELRTPLTIIQGNLEGIMDGIYPSDPDHIQAVLDETRLLSRIIDDLRTLSLAESGALKLQKEMVGVRDLIVEVKKSFDPLAASANVEIKIEVEAGLSEIELDPFRIREVIANLLTNALRYTPAQGTIIIKAWDEGNKGGEMRVAIIDNGSGIPPGDIDHIFDRFYKSADSRGSGLGLAIARGLVNAHGGVIKAEQLQDGGTTFWFSIPRQDSPHPENII